MDEHGARGERGPTGDHGQSGDLGRTGAAGATGTTGAAGAEGRPGVKGEPGPRGRTVIPRNIKLSFVAIVVIATAVLGVFGYLLKKQNEISSENHRLAIQGKQSHDVDCARKRNIAARLGDTWAFIDSGAKIPGISDAILVRGVVRDLQEWDDLVVVKCTHDPPPPRRPTKAELAGQIGPRP